MNTVCVADMGAVTALGQSPEALWDALMAGRTGLQLVKRFSTDHYVCDKAGCIPALDAEHLPSRLDTLVKMLFEDTEAILPETLLLTASTKAGIDQLERSVRSQPTDLDRLLSHHVGELVAGRIGLKDSGHNISAACASATVAVAVGASRIREGQVESVLICGLDLISEFVYSGFSAMQALSPTTCRPFDSERDGLNLGEGAAYVLLMSEDRLRRTTRRCLGRVVGWGVSSDAHHITAPARTGEGLVQAMRQALRGADLDARDIAAVCAHGTGSVYNDAMELTALGKVFASPIPIHSIKGATGHTMGACGVVETIVGLCSLENRCIPPTVGLSTPEPAACEWVSTRSQAIEGEYVMTNNSGFGGINASLVLQRGAR